MRLREIGCGNLATRTDERGAVNIVRVTHVTTDKVYCADVGQSIPPGLPGFVEEHERDDWHPCTDRYWCKQCDGVHEAGQPCPIQVKHRDG